MKSASVQKYLTRTAWHALGMSHPSGALLTQVLSGLGFRFALPGTSSACLISLALCLCHAEHVRPDTGFVKLAQALLCQCHAEHVPGTRFADTGFVRFRVQVCSACVMQSTCQARALLTQVLSGLMCLCHAEHVPGTRSPVFALLQGRRAYVSIRLPDTAHARHALC